MFSCSLHKTTWNFIQYSKQLDLKAQAISTSFYAWNKIYIFLWQTSLQMVMCSNNLLRNYTMYYVPNTYYAILMIFFLHILWQYYAKVGENFFNMEKFFLWVIVFIMLSYVLEAPLSSFTPRNWSHFCLCYFKFSLKFIGLAKSNGKKRMTFLLCSSFW